jgi:hypothetical protein
MTIVINIKTFSEYPNSNYKLRKYLLYGLILLIVGWLIGELINFILFYPFWKPNNNIEQFGTRGKCKKIFKSGYEGSSPPDECVEEGFTVIPDTHYFPDNILTHDELTKLASDLEYSVSNNENLAQYFNNIILIVDNGSHPDIGSGMKRIKFDPELDLSWIQMTLLSIMPDIIEKHYKSIILKKSNNGGNRIISTPDSNYIISTLCANIKIKIKPGRVNANYQSDGNIIHSVDISNNLDKLIVIAELSGYKTIELYKWQI